MNDLWTGLGLLLIMVGVACIMVAYKLPTILKDRNQTQLEIEKERTRQKELEFGR